MRLKDVFIEMLKEREIDRIGTSISKIIKSRDPIQKMAVYLACKKANVCIPKKKLKYSFNLYGELVEENPKAYFGRCDNAIITADEFLSRIEKLSFPYIVVDCSFYDKHSEKEKKSLHIQIRETLNVVRKFMWDDRLIVTLNCGVGRFYSSVVEFIRKNKIKDVILLDPNAESIFKGEKAECYIIGGIVDKSGNKRGLTSKIGDILKENGIPFKSKKIVLRGDTTGVPDRINAIAEIVLRVVLDNEDIENTIRKVQSPIFARKRLAKEISKFAVRVDVGSKTFRLINKSVFNKFNWLNLRKTDFYRVCSQTSHIVVADHVMNEIRKCEWDGLRKKYVIRLKGSQSVSSGY